MKRKLTLPLLVVLGLTLVSAISYYALFSATVSIHQPVSFDGELEQTVEDCNSGETCLGQEIVVSNDGDSSRTVKIVQTSGSEDIEVNYVGKLDLTKKDVSTWEAIGTPIELIYTIVGNEFNYNAELPDGYVLVYYKDAVVGLEGRLENPQPVVIIESDIGNLAQEDDANLNADYSEAPDYYEHKTGAKIWAVPESAINEDNTLDWSQMEDFYYETDLISYFANSNSEITIPADSFITIYPTFTPDTYVESGDYEFEFEIQ